MRAAVIILIALTATVSFAFADNVISWVRVHTPTMDDYRAVTDDTSLDIAAARPGEYVDLIIHGDRLSALASDGYGYEYLMYDVNDPANYAGKGYEGYTSYGELQNRITFLETNYPSIVEVTDLGVGRQGTHNVYMLKISDNVGTDDPDEADLLTTGVHHAREPMSLEVTMYFAEQLCAEYGSDPAVTRIVDELEIYVIPLLNPEGYNYDDIEHARYWWRKNGFDWPDPSEPDDYGSAWGTGVDLNRNYTYMWAYDDSGSSPDPMHPIYRGESAGSEPENQMIMDLAVAKDFVSALTFHSYSELIIRPFGYDSSNPPPQTLAIFDDIGYGYQGIIQTELGRYYQYVVGGGYNGNFIDYMYGEHSAISYCIELNSYGDGGFYPDESFIDPTRSAHYEALKWWCDYVIDNPIGIDDEGDNPIAPAAFALKPAYPNPASNAATFAFALPETAEVTLDIFDIKGRKVISVLDETVESGENEVAADVSSLSSGVYVYKLSAGDDVAAKKMVVK